MSSDLKPRTQEHETKAGDLSKRLVTVANPDSVIAEAYRSIRTKLLNTRADAPPKVIPVTSPGRGEGKSTTCANLAASLAQAGKETLVVDCDLRDPSLHKLFGLNNFQGITNILAGEVNVEQTWQKTSVPNLELLSAGAVPPNPSELLGSNRFAEFLHQARQVFDYVLLDVPPVQSFSDAAIVGAQGDGVLLVWDARKTRREDVRGSVRNLEDVGAGIIGTVMNNFKSGRADSRS